MEILPYLLIGAGVVTLLVAIVVARRGRGGKVKKTKSSIGDWQTKNNSG